MNKIIVADVTKKLPMLETRSVHTCITSPPYYGLRDYGIEGQLGLEESPEEYIERLVSCFREVHRVLRNDGTLWVVIGDSYAGSGKGGAIDPENASKYKQGTNHGMLGSIKTTKVGWGEAKHKDLIGIPWMFALAMRKDGWYLRQDIIWDKSNPMPEPIKDRCVKSHEYIFLFSKSKKYYFDYKVIQEPCANGCGFRNKRDVWRTSTGIFKGLHFATFPINLITPCVLAGSPKNGVVLDIFCGSGTTGLAASMLERDSILIDINPEYCDVANKRLLEWENENERK